MSILQKPEAIICPVFVERILNQKNLSENTCFLKDSDTEKNDARLPGKPDIVLPKYKTVIFVNGCFWHGHEGCHCFVWPKNNVEFWKKKIGSNIERDAKNHALLAKLGWNVIVVWECELKRSTAEETFNLLVHCIVQRQSYGNSN